MLPFVRYNTYAGIGESRKRSNSRLHINYLISFSGSMWIHLPANIKSFDLTRKPLYKALYGLQVCSIALLSSPCFGTEPNQFRGQNVKQTSEADV